MILVKIAMVGVAIAVMLAVARDQRWAQRGGVVGSCVATQPPRSEPQGAWYVCRQGILTGYPNLEADSCRRAGLVQDQEVWSCVRRLASLPGY